MSTTGGRVPLRTAQAEASSLKRALSPAVQRAYVVGSVRRGRDPVGDVELLVEPRVLSSDMFHAEGDEPHPREYDVEGVQVAFRSHCSSEGGEVLKQGTRMLQGTVRDGDLKVEVWICRPPAQWGTLMAIRTGPADLSKEAVTRIRERGLRVKGGAVWTPTTEEAGVPLPGESGSWQRRPTPTEREFFEAARLDFLPANRRDWLARRECRGERRRGRR